MHAFGAKCIYATIVPTSPRPLPACCAFARPVFRCQPCRPHAHQAGKALRHALWLLSGIVPNTSLMVRGLGLPRLYVPVWLGSGGFYLHLAIHICNYFTFVYVC